MTWSTKTQSMHGLFFGGSARRQPVRWTFGAWLAVFVLNSLLPTTAQAQPGAWTRLNPPQQPSQRSDPTMAYDSARHVTVLVASQYFPRVLTTCEWNGSTWTELAAIGPSVRADYAMAHDSIRGKTVLFGGYSAGNQLRDTWEWDGTSWAQRDVSGPSPRNGHAMAFDSSRDVTVLFGDERWDGDDSTWEWDGTAWTQKEGGPGPRHHHAMAYDAARGVTVLFGGLNSRGYSDEIWEWNGTSWTNCAVRGPPARSRHAMVYDSARGVTVLFGGESYHYSEPEGLVMNLFADTWEWNGITWTRGTNAGPPARSDHGMAYDAGRNVTVLFMNDERSSWGEGETWEMGLPCAAPSIISDTPESISCLGSARFSVTVAGTAPIEYQWQRGSPPTDIPGADSPDFTLEPATVSTLLEGPYTCVITNPCGSITTTPASFYLCFGDFNCDGAGGDGRDVEEFFQLWEDGQPSADLNGDGGLDSSDVGYFFEVWEGDC